MANRYYVGPAAGAWNLNANWSNISGGAGGFSFPAAGDNAYLDAGSGANGPTLTANAACDQLDCAGFVGGTLDLAGFTLSIMTTRFRLAATMFFTHNNGLVDCLAVAGTVLLTVAGWALYDLRVGNAGAGATYQLQDVMTLNHDLNHAAGIFDVNGQGLTIQHDWLLGAAVANNGVLLGAGTVEIQRQLTAATIAQFLSAGTGMVRFTGTGLHTGRDQTFYDLYVAGAGQVTDWRLENGVNTCTVLHQLTTGSGILRRSAGASGLKISSALANAFLPNAAFTCEATMYLQWSVTGAPGVVLLPTWNMAGQLNLYRDPRLAQIEWRLTANLLSTGNLILLDTDNNQVNLNFLNLNGFNLSCANAVLGSGVTSHPRVIVTAGNVWTVTGNLSWTGIRKTGEPGVISLGAAAALNIAGSLTYTDTSNGGSQLINQAALSAIAVGGNLALGTAEMIFNLVAASTSATLTMTAAGAFTVTCSVLNTFPIFQVINGGIVTLPAGFRCYDLVAPNATITMAGTLYVLHIYVNGGTFTSAFNVNVGSGFVNTGVLNLAGSNIITTGSICALNGVNPVSLTLGPLTSRLQLVTACTITNLVLADRHSPAVVQFLAGGNFVIGNLDSQVAWPEDPVQFISSVAGTPYSLNLALVTSAFNIWPRDCRLTGLGVTGGLSNKDLGGNTGWVLNSDGQIRMITDDPGRDLLEAGDIGDMEFCWLVAPSLVALTALGTAFAAGANNWHRRTNIPFAVLDNLSLGLQYFVGLGMRDDRNRRVAPNVGAGDFYAGFPVSGSGGSGSQKIVANSKFAF